MDKIVFRNGAEFKVPKLTAEETAKGLTRLNEAVKMATKDAEKLKRTGGKWPRNPDL